MRLFGQRRPAPQADQSLSELTDSKQTRDLARGVVALAIGVVAFIVGSISLVLLLVDDVREDPESLEDVVTAIAQESAALTDLYFYVAEASAEIVRSSVVLGEGSLDDPAVVDTLQRVVETHTNVNGAYVGLESGDFLYVTRSSTVAEDGYRVKRVRDADRPSRLVTETQVDRNFDPIDETANLVDDYDPRTRPWYVGALDQRDGWTEPYVFASSAEPGITYFTHVGMANGDTLAVVGVDLQLTEIGDFLDDRRPGPNGSAAIVSEESSIIIGSTVADPRGVLASEPRDSQSDTVSLVVGDLSGDAGLQVASLVPVGTMDQWTLTIVGARQDFPQSLALRIDSVRRALPGVGIVLSIMVLAGAEAALRRIRRLNVAATTDPSTGLFNAVEMRKRVGSLFAPALNLRIATLAIDLDRTRAIADTWGSEAGTAAMQQMVTRLNEHLGANGFAGRRDGNEILAAWKISPTADSLTKVEGLVDALTQPIPLDQATILPDNVVCGFTVREPNDVSSLVTVLRNTDLALLTARSQLQDVVQFDPLMELPSVRDQHRRSEMLTAIEREEFEVHFQPEVRLADNEVVGAEALLRWRRADGSLIPANDFIDDLERLEVMDLLSPLVFEQASELVARNTRPDFTVRINCCANQLANQWLLDAIEEAQLTGPSNWCIEITERTIVTSDEATLEAFDALRQAGVALALDDFGTGYSSFVELHNKPITTIKIDRSLVGPLTDDNATNSLAALIYDLASRLRLEVVAEGVETAEQSQLLQRIGCTTGQGWFFGAAVHIDDFPFSTPGTTG